MIEMLSGVNWSKLRDQFLIAFCVIVFVALLIWVLMHIAKIILLVLLAVLLAYALDPVLGRLDRYMPRGIAALLTYLFAILFLATLGYFLTRPLVAQATQLGSQLPQYFDRAENALRALAQGYGVSIPQPDQARGQLGSSLQGAAKEIVLSILNFAAAFANTVVDIVLVLFFAFWFMVDGDKMRRGFNRLFPRKYLERVIFVEDTISKVLGRYIRAQLTMAAIIGVSSGVGCLALGVPFPAVIGVLAFFFELIPMVGPVLASLPAILIALFQPASFLGIPLVIPVIVFFVLMQFLENNILAPHITGDAVGLHPVWALLSLLIGAEIAGIFGALFAVPVAGVISVLLDAGIKSWRGEPVVIRRGQMTFKMPSLRRPPRPAA
jgi:predicted PurR-regulated permease PerM